MRAACVSVVLVLLMFRTGTAAVLTVGTKHSPPFAMKADDGTWTGISIELWRSVANELGVRYEVKEFDLEGLLAAVRDRSVDVGVGALTINAAREKTMDFSHAIYSTGLSIAVVPRTRGGAIDVLGDVVTWEFASAVAGLLILLSVTGALMWLAERRRNPAQFGGGPVQGVAAGLWWSAVTMTTVGYGDKAPITLTGRLLALGWMFTAITVFSLFTATLTSALTVTRLESTIHGPDDLHGSRVGTVMGSTSAAYLDRRHVEYRGVTNVVEGLRAVEAGDLDALVYDAPILQYYVKLSFGSRLLVLPDAFKDQDYGFALPEGSTLREPINRALLNELASVRWQALVEHYLGD